MRIVLAFDKFKGTFSARQVCEMVAEGIRDRNPKIEVVQKPMADGGEGSASILAASLGMESLRVEVNDLLGKSMEGTIYWQNARRLAVIESAEVLGVSRSLISQENLLNSSSWGLGKLLRRAFDLRPQEIWICVGGTLTADAGWGAASAFGLSAYDRDGNRLTPSVENLSKISSFVFEEQPDFIKKCKVHLLCDVNAPVSGASVSLISFLKQKGAYEATVPLILKYITDFWSVLRSVAPQIPSLEAPFTGAGGGMCLGLSAVFPHLQMEIGAAKIARAIALASSFAGAQIVVTGEGCLDELTLYGKTVNTVSQFTEQSQGRLVGVFGTVDGDEQIFKKKLRIAEIFKVVEDGTTSTTVNQLIKISRQRFYSIGQQIADRLDDALKNR